MDAVRYTTSTTRLLRRTYDVLRQHWVAVFVVLVLVGSEYTAQRLTQFSQKYRISTGTEGSYATVVVRGMPYGMKIDEISYIAASRHMFESGWSGGDPYLYEYRNAPSMVPFVPVAMLRVLYAITGDIDVAHRVVKVFAIATSFAVVYAFGYSIVRGTLLPLVAATCVTLLPHIIDLLPPISVTFDVYQVIVNTLGGREGALSQFWRIPASGLVFPWLIAGIALLAWALHNGRWRPVLLAGLLIGLQPSVYPIYAPAVAAGSFFLWLWFVARRDWSSTLVMIKVGIVGIIVSLPAVFRQLSVQALPQYEEMLATFARKYSVFDWHMVYYILVVVLLWIVTERQSGYRKLAFQSILAMTLGAALSLNLHMFTGVDVQRWHWVERMTNPLLTFIIVLMVGLILRSIAPWLSRRGFRWSTAAPVIAAMIVVLGASRTISARVDLALEWAEYEMIPNDHRAAYEWLEWNVAPESVVASINFEQLALMPARANTFSYLPYRFISAAPKSEVHDRWTGAVKYYGVPEQTFADIIGGEGTLRRYHDLPLELAREETPWWFERTTIHNVLYHWTYRKMGPGGAYYQFPDSVKADLMARFNAIDDPEAALRRYRVDYIWQGPYERAIGIDSLDTVRNVELAFESGRVRIYRILDNPYTEN